jgi:hypothetical protein
MLTVNSEASRVTIRMSVYLSHPTLPPKARQSLRGPALMLVSGEEADEARTHPGAPRRYSLPSITDRPLAHARIAAGSPATVYGLFRAMHQLGAVGR